jgi:hypothetical protein
MKCIGSNNPPCARCAKAGRECIVERPARTNHVSGTSSPNSHVRVNGPSSQLRISRGNEQVGPRHNHNLSPISSNIATKELALPSIYSTPPYSTVFNQSDGSPNHDAEDLGSHRSWKRRRIGVTGQFPLSVNPADPSNSPIPEKDVVQYIDM